MEVGFSRFIKLIIMATVFEQIGGHDQLEKMVAQFYQFVLSD